MESQTKRIPGRREVGSEPDTGEVGCVGNEVTSDEPYGRT